MLCTCVTIAYRCCVCVHRFIVLYIGIDANICAMTSMTCCPREVEQAMDNAAITSTRNMLPPYALYLNESDRVFFPHYGQYILCYVLVTSIAIYLLYNHGDV